MGVSFSFQIFYSLSPGSGSFLKSNTVQIQFLYIYKKSNLVRRPVGEGNQAVLENALFG
jgi:hypothetical protein